MKIVYTKSYENSLKKIKKYKYEYETLLKIITNTKDFTELKQLPILRKYHFERLRYDLNEFYLFNLCKNGGKTRLIVRPNNENYIEIFLIYVSRNHYKDFDISRVIYYE